MRSLGAQLALAVFLICRHAEAGITPSKTDTNRYDFAFESTPLSIVLREVCEVCSANLIYRSLPIVLSANNTADLNGNVTVMFRDAEWLPALCSILDTYGLEVLESSPGSRVYCIVARTGPEGMTDLFFQMPGGTSSMNRIDLKLTDAPLRELLVEIARRGKVNIRYPSKLADTGKFTVELSGVDCEPMLVQVLKYCELNVYKSQRLNAYIVMKGFPESPPPVSPVYASPQCTRRGDMSEVMGSWVVISVITWFILLHVLYGVVRRDLASLADGAGLKQVKVRLFWGTAFVLCLIYSLTIGTAYEWSNGNSMSVDINLGQAFATGSVVACAAFYLLVKSIEFCRQVGWKLRGRWRLVTWGIAFLPLSFMLIDSPPVWRDYKWTDLPTPRNNAQESDQLFRRLVGTNTIRLTVDAPHLGIIETVTNALVYSSEIEWAWKDIEEARKVVEQLNGFDGIDDGDESLKWDLDDPVCRSYYTLRTVHYTYQAYALLRTAEGNPVEGARQLAVVHSVWRKALPYAKTLVNKMILIAFIGGDIETAWQIACSSNCTPETLTILRDAFPSILHEDVSIRWPLMAEYLAMKDLCRNQITGAKFIDAFSLFRMEEVVGGAESSPGQLANLKPRRSGLWMRNVSRTAAFMFFRRNRTVRDLRAQADLLLAGVDNRPPGFATVEEYNGWYRRHPRLTNLGGWLLVVYASPSYYSAVKQVSHAKVRSDLFAMELNRRLGTTLDLKDYYTGGEYVLDEKTGAYRSAGPDAKQGTKDDVELGQTAN